MKRLYVGGLSHTVSEKELRDRLGKFGDVSDVEIITRKDKDGTPLKTFGYVNINMTDAEYKRCVGILNKSTWKGETLLIQSAKESFLQRLAEERQQILEKPKISKISPQETIREAFKSAGIENFHMKAAVPGTEIPGHKDWVVSKFGRVLPVLNLRCKGKKKVFKYDPSKHCHNIKRLETSEDFMPASKLTWEIPGGDDEISKKRRGEFPKQKSRPKRSTRDLSSLLSRFTQNSGLTSSPSGENKNTTDVQLNGLTAKGKQRPAVHNSVCVFDSDADSEDEIRRLVAQERLKNPKQTQNAAEVEEDILEVVGDDFVVKSNIVWGKAEQDAGKFLLTSRDDEEYDSADTDEILTQSKSICAGKTQDVEPSPTKSSKKLRKANLEPVSSSSGSESDDEDDGDDEDDDDDNSSVDSDYKNMMGSCYRLELSLADLEKLAKNAEVMSDEGEEGEKEDTPSEEPKSASHKTKGNNPEDILASIREDKTSEKEIGKKKNQVSTLSLPAFIGTKDLFGESSPASSEHSLKRSGQSLDSSSTVSLKKPKQDPKLSEQSPQQSPNHPHQQESSILAEVDQSTSTNTDSSSCSSSEGNSSSEESDFSEDGKNNRNNVLTSKTSTTQSERTDQTPSKNLTKPKHPVSSREDEKKTVGNSDSPRQGPEKTNSSASSSGSSSEESETSDEDKSSRAQLKSSKPAVSKRVDSHPTVLHTSTSDVQKQLQDNQKRLAALEQRQKENEQQKMMIQEGLSNVDTVNTNRTKHIVFDSDEERDELTVSPEDPQTVTSKKNLEKKESKKSGASKLFESSDEDEDGEEDCFQIKQQFEGRAGQKLMELQSTFGTDSRFQMDSRFLESDNEKDDEGHLKSHNSRRQPGKKFKDVSALHYDPTREEHAAFEAKTEQPEKESKAARRKKRKEAEKLPEVSKEIFFDVSVDLKSVFGTSKETPEETETRTEKISWDQEAEDVEDKMTQGDNHINLSITSNTETCEDSSCGFKFSFFEESTVTNTPSKTDEYKVETLKGAKFSWQSDPRFQDSSSDEEGVDEMEQDQSASSKTTEEAASPKKKFFFFFQDDERLKEGPGMFCRNVALADQRGVWEETRTSLKQEYRKKHRDAKRRQRPLLKR